jgi:hypothetical protein
VQFNVYSQKLATNVSVGDPRASQGVDGEVAGSFCGGEIWRGGRIKIV